MGIISLLYPKKCVNCGKGSCYMCSSCLEKVKITLDRCPNCQEYSTQGATHAACLDTGLDGLVSFWKYQGVVKKAIKKLKFGFVKKIANEMAEQAFKAKNPKNILQGITFIVPVPLHKNRERVRGFNQALLLAEGIARITGIPVIKDLLIRKKSTTPQSDLALKERLENVKNVFVWNETYKLTKKNIKLLVVDDVYTSGSTMHEFASVLKKKGIKSVWGMVVAGP